jgi:C4-dicarboxylate transporter DctM subunit
MVAVGSMLIPQMLEAGYSKENSLGVVAASGTLGQMIPPSIFMILYASMTQADISKLFIAGVVPGLFIALCFIIVSIILSIRNKSGRIAKKPASEVFKSFITALPALLMPIFVLGGIYSGSFTPTEAAAIAVPYVLIISFLFNRREFTIRNLLNSVKQSMTTTAVIYTLLGGAQIFSNAITFAQVPQKITAFLVSMAMPDWALLFTILVFLVLLGMILDETPILFITVPILYPIISTLGIDLIHFGIFMVAALMIGQLTPPVGYNLFIVSGAFKENIIYVIKGMTPYLIALGIATIIIMYVPWLSTMFVK